jgi:aminoglycoside N3'-acetyltransferase
VVCLAVLAGSGVRVLAESALNRSLEPVKAYGRIARLAGRCLLFGWRDEVVVSGPAS